MSLILAKNWRFSRKSWLRSSNFLRFLSTFCEQNLRFS
jgi:hypothetical protein